MNEWRDEQARRRNEAWKARIAKNGYAYSLLEIWAGPPGLDYGDGNQSGLGEHALIAASGFAPGPVSAPQACIPSRPAAAAPLQPRNVIRLPPITGGAPDVEVGIPRSSPRSLPNEGARLALPYAPRRWTYRDVVSMARARSAPATAVSGRLGAYVGRGAASVCSEFESCDAPPNTVILLDSPRFDGSYENTYVPEKLFDEARSALLLEYVGGPAFRGFGRIQAGDNEYLGLLLEQIQGRAWDQDFAELITPRTAITINDTFDRLAGGIRLRPGGPRFPLIWFDHQGILEPGGRYRPIDHNGIRLWDPDKGVTVEEAKREILRRRCEELRLYRRQ
jgi:hypothetical protein